MRLLLDTHILLWVLEDNAQLSRQAKTVIQNTTNDVFVSAASLFEIAIKARIGKLNTRRTPTEIARELTDTLAIELLPVLPRHLDAYQDIPLFDDHRDPFDRLLLATALAERLALVSDDSKFSRYSDLISLIQ